jgi:hypothetical protein
MESRSRWEGGRVLFLESFTVGVGQSLAAYPRLIPPCAYFVLRSPSATGVGHRPSLFGPLCEDENAITEVRGTNGCRRNAVPLRIVPARGQVSENAVKPPNKEC